MKITFIRCEVGQVLFDVWLKIEKQKSPKATKLEISSARSAYRNHRKLCEKCKVIYG